MRVPLYQVDAFANRRFAGNPAAVCELERWLRDDTLQAVAAENNLSETAFLVPAGDGYELRWFTPTHEVDLCGHATLAAAHVLLHHLDSQRERVTFRTRSGELEVWEEDERLAMRFPSLPPGPCERPDDLIRGLGAEPTEVLAAKDYMAVFGGWEEVETLEPEMVVLRGLDRRGVIVTAPGEGVGEGIDFVSRFFAPGVGVPEDPVTGSAHCTLAPYWADRLGRSRLHGRQISRRGGDVHCRMDDPGTGTVILAGEAVLYLEGSILL